MDRWRRRGGGGGEGGNNGVGVLEAAGGVGGGDCGVGGGYGAEEYGAHAIRVDEWGDDGWAGYGYFVGLRLKVELLTAC